jgi:hypothetical protein
MPSPRYHQGMEATPSRQFRKLRIAWSVAWGLVAVLLCLLCLLWLRSYWRYDIVLSDFPGRHPFSLQSLQSRIVITVVQGKCGSPRRYYHSLQDRVNDSYVEGVNRSWSKEEFAPGFRYFSEPHRLAVGAPYWFIHL